MSKIFIAIALAIVVGSTFTSFAQAHGGGAMSIWIARMGTKPPSSSSYQTEPRRDAVYPRKKARAKKSPTVVRTYTPAQDTQAAKSVTPAPKPQTATPVVATKGDLEQPAATTSTAASATATNTTSSTTSTTAPTCRKYSAAVGGMVDTACQ